MLIDRVYELEGLLLLLNGRKDLPEGFKSIIVDKARVIFEEAEQLTLPPKDTDLQEEAQAAEFEEAEDANVKPAANPEPKTEIKHEDTAEAVSKPAIRFPINDRIRFSRELFNGDASRFDSTVAFVEALPDWTDVEDYFYSDLAWDPSNSSVAEFADMLHHLYNRSKQ